MLMFLCDRCRKPIENYNGHNDRDALKFIIDKEDGLGGWHKILLCNECADKLTEWLKEK